MDETLTQDVIVDLTESQIVVIYANQYDDNSRTINCHIQNEGVDFDCSGYTVALLIKKTNGHGLSRTIGSDFGSVKNNIVSFPIIEKMTLCYGRQICNLQFKDNNGVVHSSIIYLHVNEAAIKKDDIIDSDDYDNDSPEDSQISADAWTPIFSGYETLNAINQAHDYYPYMTIDYSSNYNLVHNINSDPYYPIEYLYVRILGAYSDGSIFSVNGIIAISGITYGNGVDISLNNAICTINDIGANKKTLYLQSDSQYKLKISSDSFVNIYEVSIC